ncbi:MAG: type IX secretion system plug protein domain-containing protein [Bacteroidota bacterium]
MKVFMRYFVTFFCFFFLAILSFGQKLEEKIYKPEVKTVQVQKKGDSLAPPVIHLNSDDQVILSFDELEIEPHSYSYKVIHCDAQWQPSDLMEHEYLYSQFETEIQYSKNSMNTIIPYIHYRESIPNDRIEPSISGNYAILVYDNSNPEDTVLVTHFRMTESKVSVQAGMERINEMSPDKPNQELNFSVNTGSFSIQNPYRSVKAVIKQNGHNTRFISNVNPSSFQGNKMTYRNMEELKFKGGNEFHHFNSKSVEFAGKNVEQIDFVQNRFHFKLSPDKSRTYKDYKSKKELNGKFQIDKERTDSPHLEADYVYVYFTLKDETPEMSGGKVYVTGGFNNWKHSENTEMKYNFDQKAYEKRVLLKQGYYNYKYELVDDQGVQETFYSGNHAQTENDYEVYIYYKDISKGYDRLIGHTLYNSSDMDY